MGAVRVWLSSGGEDVFADEIVGGDETHACDAPTTVFDYGFEVLPGRRLAVTITQLFRDARYSPAFHPVGSVHVAFYQPSEWVSVSKL